MGWTYKYIAIVNIWFNSDTVILGLLYGDNCIFKWDDYEVVYE